MTTALLRPAQAKPSPFRWTGPEAPLPGTRPVFLYLRLSRSHGDGRDAIERQRLDLTRKLAAEGGWTVMGEYVDRDSASAYARTERAGWRALNAGIASGRVRAVAFWKLDRTLRVASRCLEWVTSCQQQGVTLLSHQDSTEELNSVTAAAKLSTGVKALLAEAETETMSERQRAAKRHAAQAGFINGGRRPFGWQPGPRVTDSAGRTGRRLEPHPVEHQALKDAVALVLSGTGLREVAVHWQSRFGITGPGGGLVSEQKVRAALISPRMVGYRQHQLPPHRRGVSVDPLDYIARTPDGEPVISQDPVCELATWHRVQGALRSRSMGARNGWGARAWLLTGLLRCPCGRPLAGVAQSQKPDADGHRAVRFVYRCKANRRHGAGTCTGGASITAPPAEQYVIDWLFEFFSSDRLDAHNKKAESANVEAVTRIDTELAESSGELDALRGKAASLTVGSELHQIVAGMIARVQERIANLHDERVALTIEHPTPFTHEQLVAIWPTLNNESRRTLLRQLINHIDLVPGRGSAAERLNIVMHAKE